MPGQRHPNRMPSADSAPGPCVCLCPPLASLLPAPVTPHPHALPTCNRPHSPLQGVKDVWFANDGRRFVSTGYDKKIRYWDTETGQIIT